MAHSKSEQTPVEKAESGNKGMMCGGLMAPRPATDEIQGIVDGLRKSIHEQLGSTPSHLKVHSYRSQVVNGTNYWIKVETNPEKHEFIHLRVHQPIGGDAQLVRLQANKGKEDEIGSF